MAALRRARPARSRRTRSARTTSTRPTTPWRPAGPGATSTRSWSARTCIAPLFAARRGGRRHRRRRGRDGPVRRPRHRPREGSTAHVARLLDAPVMLVVDASAQSRSVAALVHGFASYDRADPDRRRRAQPRRLAAARAVATRVAGRRPTAGIPVVGALPRDAARRRCRAATSGWCPAQERGRRRADAVDALGALIEQHLDVDRPSLALAAAAAGADGARRGRPRTQVGAPVGGPPGRRRRRRRRLHLRLRRDAPSCWPRRAPRSRSSIRCATSGCRPAPAALVIGGGFPEVHAEQLSANAPLRARGRRARRDGRADRRRVRRVCSISREASTALPMCGVLPVDAQMTERLTLGYREAVPRRRRTPVRAHEFHRTALHARRPARRPPTRSPTARPRASRRAGSTRPTCTCTGRAVPALARDLVAAA